MRKIVLLCTMLFTLSFLAYAQVRTITGTVTDHNGLAVADASVLIRGTNTGTSTDANGQFTINVPPNRNVLVISAVGFAEKEVAIGNATALAITLAESTAAMEEVVVVGYGVQKRREVTGNYSSVTGAEISNRPMPSFESGLAGKAAGVQITVPNGVVNNPPVFRIRGVNSLSLSNSPLIVIDGIPSLSGDQGGTSAPANPLASLNPDDIESIDIAKDAAASAIYGSRAANGVVFITTKKGKNGAAKLSYNGWIGWSKPTRLPEILNTQQYLDYKNMALANLKSTTPTTTGQFIIPNDANGKPISTNWYDIVYRTGFAQNHNVNVSGATNNTSYYFSGGYTKQEGILQKNSFERKNVLLNVDGKISNVISVGGKAAYSNEGNKIGGSSGSLPGEGFASAGAARLAFALPPNVSPYNNDGKYNYSSGTAIGGQGSLVGGSNPYTFNNIKMLLDLNRSNNEVNHIQSSAYAQIKPIKNLILRSVYSIDYLFIDNDIFYNPFHGDGFGTGIGPGGAATASYYKLKTSLWTNTAQYDFSVASNNNFSLLIGNEQQWRNNTGFGINRRTLTDSAYTVIQGGYTTNGPAGMFEGKNYLLSTFGRINYNYGQKYFVSANLRQDEYSALGRKKGVFWGVSAGWEIMKENFWKNSGISNVFSNLKLRGSYGRVGNVAGVGDFASFSQYASGLYGGTGTLFFSSVGNPDITWETSTKTDFGFEFGLLKNRVTGDFAVYKNNIDNLLLFVPQAPSAGLPTSIFQNVGKMYNQGVEFSITATPVLKEDFQWKTSFNIGYNKNMVTELAPGLTEVITATSGLETVNKTVPNYSAGYLWVVKSGGVDPATGRRIFIDKNGKQVFYQHDAPTVPQRWKYDDGSVSRAINQSDDGVLYANALPKTIGGWENNLNYKGLDLNFLFTYQMGFYIYYGSYAGLRDQRFWNNSVDVLRYWKTAGDITDMPRPVYGDNVSNGSAIPMDINVFKGDFLKLKSATLSYNLPRDVVSKARLSSARVYVSGQNLLIFTKYPGPDPEVSSNGNSGTSFGVDRNTLANGRTITIGLNIGF